jgi:hypothetical protein
LYLVFGLALAAVAPPANAQGEWRAPNTRSPGVANSKGSRQAEKSTQPPVQNRGQVQSQQRHQPGPAPKYCAPVPEYRGQGWNVIPRQAEKAYGWPHDNRRAVPPPVSSPYTRGPVCNPQPAAPMPLLGSQIIGYGNVFLGVISPSRQQVDSISNPYGRYGDLRSSLCIFNPQTRWGDEHSPYGIWSTTATHPPRVYYGNHFRGYLTRNPCLEPRINPYWLINHLQLDLW